MATINTFEELDIWQLGREICQDVWDKFENTSLGKDFELKNQMNGFLIMYEVKKEETLKELSKKL
jgi:hypothetical protein